MHRLQTFEKLKPQHYSLLDLPVESIFEALAVLVGDDPHKVWGLIEDKFGPNFLEPVIVRRYAHVLAGRMEEEDNLRRDI
jgi:hypothetical protein